MYYSCLLKDKEVRGNRGPQKGMAWKKYTSIENLMGVVGSRVAKSCPKLTIFITPFSLSITLRETMFGASPFPMPTI